MNPPLFKGEVLRDRRATCPELPVGFSFGSVSQLVDRPPDARHQAKIRPAANCRQARSPFQNQDPAIHIGTQGSPSRSLAQPRLDTGSAERNYPPLAVS